MFKDRFTKQFWISLGIIAASIIIAVVVLNYFAGDMDAQASAIVSARGQAQAQTAAIANLAALKSQAPQAAQYQAAIDGLLPDQYNLVTFPQWFARLGTQYGVSANATITGSLTPSAGATPGSTSFSFGVSGKGSAVTDFLDVMSTKAPGFILTIGMLDVTSDGNNYNVTGQGTLFTR